MSIPQLFLATMTANSVRAKEMGTVDSKVQGLLLRCPQSQRKAHLQTSTRTLGITKRHGSNKKTGLADQGTKLRDLTNATLLET